MSVPPNLSRLKTEENDDRLDPIGTSTRISASQIIPQNVLLLIPVGSSSLPAVKSIEITPIDACNHDCGWCFTRDARSSRKISTTALKAYLDEFIVGGGRSVTFSGGGEPLLFKPLLDEVAVFDDRSLLEYCLDRRLAVGLITNGRGLRQMCLKLGQRITELAFVRISLDATNQVDHSKLHKTNVGDFKHILCGIEELAAIRGSHSTTPAIGISFVVDSIARINFEACSITEIARLASRLGVDFAQLKHVHLNRAETAHAAMQIAHLRCQEASAWGKSEYWVHHYLQPRPTIVCLVPTVGQLIDAGGQRFPCCHLQSDDSFFEKENIAPIGTVVRGCKSSVCRYVSVNEVLTAVAKGIHAEASHRHILRESILRDGYHPYRLFPSAPDLFSPWSG